METIYNNIPQFYYCPICGNLIEIICASGNIPYCCGQEMQLLESGTVDASLEKHVPVYSIDEHIVSVQVGSDPHPMAAEHHIVFIEMVTNRRICRQKVYPKEHPTAYFHLGEDEIIISIFEYCNIHGLWSTQHINLDKENKKK